MESNNTSLSKIKTNSTELFQASCSVDISGLNKSVAEIRNLGGQPISSLVVKTETGVDKSECHKFIKLSIVWMCEFFGVSWSDLQIQESAKQLYENYYFWTEYDWRHFMNRVISGYYGKVYGAFAPAAMMEFALAHNKEWMDVGEYLNEHQQDILRKTNEIERQSEQKQLAETEDRIHQSAIEAFKKTIIKP